VPPAGGSGFLLSRNSESNLMLWVGLSTMLHLSSVLLVWLVMIIFQFLGWNIPMFDNLAMKPRDVEFVLVDDSPKQQPRKPTNRRAEHASRSGGQRIKNQPVQISKRAAGAPSNRAQQQPAVKPQPRPQPSHQPTQRQQVARKPVAQPTPQPQPKAATTPKPTPQPAPPAPKLPRPVKIASANPSMPPNPIAPIKVPAPKNPSISGGGPVAKTPGSGVSGGTSAGSSGNPGPSMIGGAPSRGSSGSGARGSSGRTGGGGGSGGQGSYNQSGSPGGGGGRAGIDAMEEPDFGPYIAELQRRIRRNWSPPVEDQSKRVVALFKISRDGRLLSLRIQQSSGSPPADQAAMSAVRASAPFRQLPPNYRGQDIDVQFIFDYEIYGKGGQAKMR
jgi:TonB family protein